MTIPLGALLPIRSSCQPGSSGLNDPVSAVCANAQRTSRKTPIWHCSQWGLPCRLRCRKRGELLPHRFTLTSDIEGGLFSVALSLGLPPPGVTRHCCPMESGLSSRPSRLAPPRTRGHPAIRAVWDLGCVAVRVNGKAHSKITRECHIDAIQIPDMTRAKAVAKSRQARRQRHSITIAECAQIR